MSRSGQVFVTAESSNEIGKKSQRPGGKIEILDGNLFAARACAKATRDSTIRNVTAILRARRKRSLPVEACSSHLRKIPVWKVGCGSGQDPSGSCVTGGFGRTPEEVAPVVVCAFASRDSVEIEKQRAIGQSDVFVSRHRKRCSRRDRVRKQVTRPTHQQQHDERDMSGNKTRERANRGERDKLRIVCSKGRIKEVEKCVIPYPLNRWTFTEMLTKHLRVG